MSPVARRRNVELRLGLVAIAITVFGYLLVQLAERPNLPPDLWLFVLVVIGLYAIAHFAVRELAPNADPVLLPLAALLTGIGYVTISRLDPELARAQAGWMAAGVAAFVVTLIVVRRVRTLEVYKYTFLFFGVVALLLPLLPGFGKTINGARLWVGFGPLNFQPGEAAKVLLVIFFAAYLVDKRELLASGTRRIGRMMLPRARYLGPLLLAWGFSILIMVMQKDLGSSLLFFAVFAAMLYVATDRAAYLVMGLIMFVGGAAVAYQLFQHVQDRLTIWSNPWPEAQDKGFQIVQSMFAFGTGGFAGTGLGLGNPQQIPNAPTDFVFSAIGEELGLLGTIAVLAAILLFVGSGFRIAVQADRPFPKLFAAGLTITIGVQTFVIIGGVTRVIPLTGVTLPFISYGGSSLIANFVVLALLLRISDDNARAPTRGRAGAAAAAVHS
ncbi:MAG TPA: FtsW/RodA/SpoVE family cell cycle protein [Acidimicrobiia bacterium]